MFSSPVPNCVIACHHVNFSLHFSHENSFLLAGLKVKKLPNWAERQAAYLSSVKEFLAKLKPEFASLPIRYVKYVRYEPKLLLSVECEKPKQ
jgi:hypothetical protein